MEVKQQLKSVSLILVAIVSLHACKNKPVDVPSPTTAVNATADGKWLNNLNEAQAESIKENKPILAYFTSSDTCRLCKKMDTDVFSTPTFKEWAAKSVVLLQLDFSKKNQVSNNEQNTGMARSLKVNEYPTFWILNITHEPDNNRFKVKPIGRIGYQETPEKFIGMLHGFMRR